MTRTAKNRGAQRAKRARAVFIAALCLGASCAALSKAPSSTPRSPTLDPPAPVANAAPILLTLNGLESPYHVMSAFVLPGGVLTLEVAAKGFTVSADSGRLERLDPLAWNWTAPAAAGVHELHVHSGGSRSLVRVFVLRPYYGGTTIGGYRLGHYVRDAKEGDPAYRIPEGFVEVTARNFDTMVSPHFRLGQFLCKDEVALPKFIALCTSLLVKLEMLVDALAARGLAAPTLHVMSGYRTPVYNAAIGNQTSISRHLYGDAADVFLDRDGDEMQDDLDGDGRSTRADARVLHDLVERMDASLPEAMQGGLAVYGATAAHGPFVHLDLRGRRARW